MRRFVVEVVIDGLIIFILLLILSFIHIPQPFPFGEERAPIFERQAHGVLPYLWAGLVIAVVERLVRPLVVALTGRLVLSTMGLFLAIVFLTLYFVFKNKVSKMSLSVNLQAVDMMRHLAVAERMAA